MHLIIKGSVRFHMQPADMKGIKFDPFEMKGIIPFKKIALVIIENGARWLVENFVLSRYNHRQVIMAMTAFNFQNVDVSETLIFVFVLFSR